MLFLSRNVTCPPAPRCPQPSGYFIEYPAALFRNVRNTWLSGMSPVAAACASGVSGDGAAAVVVAPCRGTVVVVVAGDEADEVCEPPQPARAAGTTRTKRIARARIAWDG